MNISGADNPQSTDTTVLREANSVCDECGAYGAFVFDDIKLCARCYSERGSCCQESERSGARERADRTTLPRSNDATPGRESSPVKESRSMTKPTEQTRAPLAALIEQSQAGVIVVDANLRVVQINRKAETTLGRADDLLGRDLSEVLRSIWSIEYMSGIIDRIQYTLLTGQVSPGFDVTGRQRKTDQLQHYSWQLGHVFLPGDGRGVACSFEKTSDRGSDGVAATRRVGWRDFLADISSQLLLTKQPRSLVNAVFRRLAVNAWGDLFECRSKGETRTRWHAVVRLIASKE